MSDARTDENSSTPAAAVIYLRVSTKDQAQRGGEAEGFSIPAQRDACTKRAEALGATVVMEFVDAGESARSAARPELQQMLDFLRKRPCDYVIVYKVDRLARNRVDDVEINLAIQKAGAKLVSVTENIDETPSGALLHGIMSSIAEFYSRNLAQEVVKGLTQKARTGGTISRAPLGYLNVREFVNGRENRHVIIDPERADDIRWAFEAYATGEWSLSRLAAALEVRGFTQRATQKQIEKPIRRTQLHAMLQNRYYAGYVTFRGVKHKGSHEPLIDEETFERVQEALRSHNQAGVQQRKHLHYLTGSLFCKRCKSRMLYMITKGRRGGTYEYFACTGRHSGQNGCDLPYVPLYKIEEQVDELWQHEQDEWERVGIPQISEGLRDQLRAAQGAAAEQRSVLDREIGKIKRQRYKWADQAMDGVVPADIAREKQQQLARRLASLEEQRSQIAQANSAGEDVLMGTIELIRNCGVAYNKAGVQLRRVYNQAWFERIYVNVQYQDMALAGERSETLETLHAAAREVRELQQQQPAATTGQTEKETNDRGENSPGWSRVQGLISTYLVELRGLEPLTPTLPVWCATSCAIAPSRAHRSYTTATGRSKSLVRAAPVAHAPADSRIAYARPPRGPSDGCDATGAHPMTEFTTSRATFCTSARCSGPLKDSA